MRPVFANSAWVSAPERSILRNGRWRKRMLQVRYGFFVHPSAGPVLIDTGYTMHSLDGQERSAALRAYGRMLSPKLVFEERAEIFLAHFGLTPSDISRVFVTHFHGDHVSGLAGFDNARFTACRDAWARLQDNSVLQNLRHGVFTELIPQDFGERLDAIEDCELRKVAHLPDSYDIFGDGSVLAVPLPGHADGHFGLLFDQLETPLLYAADTQWISEALAPERRPVLLPRMIAERCDEVVASSDLVFAFSQAGGDVLLCHDDASSPFDFAQGAVL